MPPVSIGRFHVASTVKFFRRNSAMKRRCYHCDVEDDKIMHIYIYIHIESMIQSYRLHEKNKVLLQKVVDG